MAKKNIILVIDDDPDVISALNLTLKSGGYEVISATNGEQALEKFEDASPDFVLCDIMMEKIDTGIRVVTEMRKKNADVPIYLLSDIGQLTAANIDIYELGCNGSLQKPIDPDKLLSLVKHAIK